MSAPVPSCQCGHSWIVHRDAGCLRCKCEMMREVKIISLDRHWVARILLKIHEPSVVLGIFLMWTVAWLSR